MIRSQYYEELITRSQRYKFERNYYRNCIVPLEDYLIDLASPNRKPFLSSLVLDEELIEKFERVARENGRSAEAVLSDFVKDYIVSGGHPELVGDK